jgi:hypothetical protein
MTYMAFALHADFACALSRRMRRVATPDETRTNIDTGWGTTLLGHID